MTERCQSVSFVAPHDSDLGEVFENVHNRIHGPARASIHPGSAILQQAERIISDRYPATSAGVSPEDLLQWFSVLGLEGYDGIRGWWHTYRRPAPKPEIANGGGVSLFMTTSTDFDSRTEEEWSSVQVIGQSSSSDSGGGYQDGLLSLCDFALGVFACQPTRLFLHGLYICGSRVELWVFDRSGLYCSDVLDVHKSPDLTRFLSHVLSYRLMTDEQLGRSDLIKSDEDGNYIMISNAVVGPDFPSKFYIQPEPIALHGDQVSAGTTCYLARMPQMDRWNYVVKFKWRRASDRPEEEMLKAADEKKISGVAPGDLQKPDGTASRLFQDARIIHQDISATNIVIVDSESEGRPVGFLIDLDVALHIDVGPRTPGEVTGTRPFMAIGILKGRHRTYRHDLDSFLYVLVWMLITNGEHSPPDTSLLRGWSRGTREDSAMQKMRYMTKDSFPTILAEFPLQFHHLSSLAETLRAILYPVMDDGTIWTGTDSMAVDEIYDGMISAFEEAIAQELTEI
ncbi:serine/threonine-protein kinase Sgk2 [Dichotomopilus funicola]|uniref:Serine/threonine-protein kinase Sgk2 n=1 Tax=Dichotomopilus funicola TaxID=1934379 RepID=A0AAN6V486_9PEZI|nr:serine/threonine-protein kinase Sgk2 [Dichotomopilus funicola]